MGNALPREMTVDAMDNKIFTYDEASGSLEEVREITTSAHNRLQDYRDRIEEAPPGSRRAKKLSEWINTVIDQWAEEISAIGAVPKGLWTVDFDSGKGYYFCWTLNEKHLSYFHNYEEGFLGRKPLSEIPGGPTPPRLLN